MFDKLKWQRESRSRNGNLHTKTYEKTYNGFLMRLYRNMESRIVGIQKEKHYLYEGKYLLPRHEFYEWAKNSTKFYELFEVYKASNWDRKLAPSVDRIDSSNGYSIDNMEWVTLSENSRRSSLNKNKLKIELISNGISLGVFESIREACNNTEYHYYNLYNRVRGKVKNKNPEVRVL
jgi:hypothetical protein